MRTAPEVFGTRQEAERAFWKMADDGRAASNTDRRFRALVLLATFASRTFMISGTPETRSPHRAGRASAGGCGADSVAAAARAGAPTALEAAGQVAAHQRRVPFRPGPSGGPPARLLAPFR